MVYLGYLLARMLCAVLPLRVSYWTAERVADLWYAFGSRTRASVRSNLRALERSSGHSAGEGDLARRIMRNFARVVVEFLYLPRLTPSNLSRYVDVESFLPLKAMAENGAVFVTAHLGNWELGGVVLAMLGIDLHVVVYDHPHPGVARLFRSRRQDKGIKVMAVEEAGKIMRSVIGRASIGIVGDRDYSGQGMRIEFLGVPTSMPWGYAHLAISEEVPIITGFCLRDADRRYRLVLEPPLYEPGEAKTTTEVVQVYAAALEKNIEKYTDQWYLFENLERGND